MIDDRNSGKDYDDYLALERKRNGPKKKARMEAALRAKREREAAGIDISIPRGVSEEKVKFK